MFCPNCAQSFDSNRQHQCPICGFHLGLDKLAEAEPVSKPEAPTVFKKPTTNDTAMDTGIRKAVGLILIAVAFFFVYKVLAFLYPASDTLIPGTRSITLFESGGQAILGLLFGAGILRALYALTVERKRDLRTFADK